MPSFADRYIQLINILINMPLDDIILDIELSPMIYSDKPIIQFVKNDSYFTHNCINININSVSIEKTDFDEENFKNKFVNSSSYVNSLILMRPKKIELKSGFQVLLSYIF